jgi:hypothetical protein
MKTIEEEAKDKSKDASWLASNEVYNAFIEGVEFAQRWILVDEELPIDRKNAKMVLVKLLCEPHKATKVSSPPNINPFVVISMGTYDHSFKSWSIIHHLIENKFHAESYKVTHWRYIELK